MSEIKFKLTAGTDIGLERNNNEDNFVVCANLQTSKWFIPQESDDLLTLGNKGCLLVVADGMGGMNAGEIASSIAIETVKHLFESTLLTEQITKDAGSIIAYLKKVVKETDQAIKQHSLTDELTKGMGTTIVIAWVLDECAYLAWCGDSRIYSYHPQIGLRQLTKDHSYVQQLVDSGKLDPKYAFDHPDSNIILRSLGDPEKRAVADTLVHPMSNEEILLLCSDGLSGLCRDNDLEEIIKTNYEDLFACKTALVQAALSAGGYDNITVALFQQISGGRSFDKQQKKEIITTHKPYKKIFSLFTIIFLLVLVGSIGFYYGTKRNAGVRNENATTSPPHSDTDNTQESSSGIQPPPVGAEKNTDAKDSPKEKEIKIIPPGDVVKDEKKKNPSQTENANNITISGDTLHQGPDPIITK